MTKTFTGANVFMSRNLVPPETFDALHDALKLNGAQVFLCCDPSRNAPNDYHVISSRDHEKFNDLLSKGCNLIGPQCVLCCAKEHRVLPKQGYTCCLAMDGVKVLASGFDKDEKAEIGNLVTAMGGMLHAKASSDVSFVIVKNVLAAKYKCALNVLKKPIVTVNWLHQCWKEHRVVPQESYRILPFSGLTICVTKVPADVRKEMEKLVIQNGGKYSAELTRKCTHLICDAPGGDKYMVAKRWGHISVVSRKWFDQSVARKACLNEESYPVLANPAPSISTGRTSMMSQRSQEKVPRNSQWAPSSVVTDSNLQTGLCDVKDDPDLQATLSQTFSDAPVFVEEEDEPPENDMNLDGCVADDSQTEDNDLYLSDCRILLVGFDAFEMRKLVSMVRRGGGSRYMSSNEKLTHIVVGTPSEIERKEVRGLAALGVINIVRTAWLEDCVRGRKEVPVLKKHSAYDLLLPKESVASNKGAVLGTKAMKEGKLSNSQSFFPDDQLRQNMFSEAVMSSERIKEPERDISLRSTMRNAKRNQFDSLSVEDKGQQKIQRGSSNEIQDKKSSIFIGRVFRFSSSFPEDRRPEIIQWINQGGGEVVNDQTQKNVDFTVECHGAVPSSTNVTRSTNISTHWIRSCLEDGHLLDVGSHILYSPLPCQVPLPGFERFRFCVSQYDEKDRILLRNLCFVLGAKFVEKLTKKVTHLLCKFTNGPKYEAASKRGILSVTSEWISECVMKNEVVATGPFSPKEVTSQDREAGLCTMSQYPTQAFQMASGVSQLPSQPQPQSQFHNLKNIKSPIFGSRSDPPLEEAKNSNTCNKRARPFEDDHHKGLKSRVNIDEPVCKNNKIENAGESSCAVPDVAAAIEDLLEQTSKIHDKNLPEQSGCDKNIYSSACSILSEDHADPHPTFGLSKHWINRIDKRDESCITPRNPNANSNAGIYDGFSETQTESQVVGYEEDLSGRQMIIDRVRTRSSLA